MQCYFLVSEQESNQRSQLKEALNGLLSAALRATFGGCALHAPAGAAAIRSALLKNLPGTHLASAQHLNNRNLQTYGFAVGDGSALAALPIWKARNFRQKIGTFSA